MLIKKSHVKESEIFFVDPYLDEPEVEAYKHMLSYAPSPMSYHSPAKNGISSLEKKESEVNLKAIILLGSSCSIFDNHPWQKDFHAWVAQKAYAGLPILAICYSHQLIAHIFGGDVAPVNSGKKIKGCRKIIFCSPYFDFNRQLVNGYVLSSHYEHVSSMPKDMEVLAYSQEVKYEALYHKRLPILSFQAHLEARHDFCKYQNLKISNSCYKAFSLGEDIIKFFYKKFVFI